MSGMRSMVGNASMDIAKSFLRQVQSLSPSCLGAEVDLSQFSSPARRLLSGNNTVQELVSDVKLEIREKMLDICSKETCLFGLYSSLLITCRV